MKTKILLLTSAMCMALGLQAQAPQKFNYQGIARTGAGVPMVNQALGLKISILDGNTAQYVEKHTVMTNDIGLYTLQIGGGTVVNGSMAAVTWSTGNKKIKVLIDPNGGTNYTNMGTTELLSVPYALFAAQGTQGPQGVPGAPGSPGAIGPQGPQGPPGTAGGFTAGDGVNISGGNVISSTLGTSIETAELANNAVTSAKIANGTVATADLANNAVTGVKIAPMGATDGQVLKYNGTAWAPATVAQGASGWGLSGNVASATDFIGTTNDEDLRFKVNGQTAGVVSYAPANTSLGTKSLGSLTTGQGNVAFGREAMSVTTTGSYNTALGVTSMFSNTTGAENTAVGDLAMYSNSTGGGNVAVGNEALRSNTTGTNNTAVGNFAKVEYGNLTNATAFGANAMVSQSNSLVMGSINGSNDATASTKVGIGTTAPSAPLEVKGNSYTTIPQLRLRENTVGYSRIHFQNSNTGAWVLAGVKATNAANSLFNVFYSEGTDGNGGSDILSISGQGKVGINTSPAGTGTSDGALCIRANGPGGHHLTLSSNSNQKWSYRVDNIEFNLEMYCNGVQAGNFHWQDGAYFHVSDRRLKENITPANNILDRIKGIEVMRYTFKADQRHAPQLGYIAQNLEEHFPEFVNRPDTTSGEEKYYTVNYAGMSAVAIKAIQEQQEMIESLQQTMAEMRSRLDRLEK